MTTTATTEAPIYSVPREGLIHSAGSVVVTLDERPTGGYLLRVTDNGVAVRDECSFHVSDGTAIPAYRALVAKYPAPVVTLVPPARGTATKVSDPLHTILAVAQINGQVRRGGHEGQADVRQLKALAKRGYLDLIIRMDGLRKVVTGATISGPGRIRLADLTAADREAARHAEAVAHTLAHVAHAA